ncbi:hypothetical protein [Streptomyces sp. TS71-3]|uniref:hypothetical protein n=1 Tax=Streptomyces sp. TS71-3 TaxID=2733862 RepID=UPI001BB3D6CD|nr:hypothetical protein [Streptomyces sp. TS71-3]
MVGTAVGLCGMLVCVLLVLVLLFTGTPDGLEGTLDGAYAPLLVTVVPGVVCGAAGGIVHVRRGRGSGRGKREAHEGTW